MNHISIDGYTRVSKRKARRLFMEGVEILVLPCKVNPANVWEMTARMSNSSIEDFEKWLNEYSYYSCNYNELGRYPAFYIKEKEA